MNSKKIIALALLGAALLSLLFSVITLGVSAGMVNDVEDALSYSAGVDFKLNGGDIKDVISILRPVFKDIDTDESIFELLSDELGLENLGFKVFCLYARGWFFAFAILFILAAAVILVIAENPSVIGMAGNLCKTIGASLVASVTAMFAAAKTAMAAAPKANKARKSTAATCPVCGAVQAPGTQFCVSCGSKMPDPSIIGVCFNCGVRNDPNARFCANCGKPLQVSAAAPVTPAAPAEPVAPAAAENNAAENNENTQL